jgi:predicted nucleic acid-binding protein
MALVIDASGMLIALLGRSDEAAALHGRLGSEVCHAPHLIDAEASCHDEGYALAAVPRRHHGRR